MTADLALTRPDPTMDEASLRVMMAAAERYVASGLLPSTVRTPQQALIIMAQGRELGIPATVALRGIVVVNGKPTCSAELMMALVHRAYGQSAMRVFKTDNEACTVQYRQAGWDGVSEYTFSMEDAKRAGLLKNPTWGQYPAAMLRARAISATVRFAFPECISGVYLPEEMGASVDVVDGEVVLSEQADDDRDRCDADAFNRRFHVVVKGTRFEDDETRHKFMAWYTKGSCSSLHDFLSGATTEDAATLLVAIKARIEAEARKRRALEEELRRVVEEAQVAGGSVDVPEDLAELTDVEIREIIDPLREALDSLDAVTA
jgi:hypothetical protein